MVALGAGVTNKRLELDGEIRTTIGARRLERMKFLDERGKNGACRFRHSLASFCRQMVLPSGWCRKGKVCLSVTSQSIPVKH